MALVTWYNTCHFTFMALVTCHQLHEQFTDSSSINVELCAFFKGRRYKFLEYLRFNDAFSLSYFVKYLPTEYKITC